jgi:hypothetical protein
MVKTQGKQVVLKGSQQQPKQKEKSDSLLKKSQAALGEFRRRHPGLGPALDTTIALLQHDPSKLQDALENPDGQSELHQSELFCC